MPLPFAGNYAMLSPMGVRIVVVDDHRILRDSLRLRLQQEMDFEVVGEAAAAAEAYVVLEQAPADLVILDLDLPGEKGVSVVKQIHQRWPDLRVLVLTGVTGMANAEELLLAGARGYLRKEDASEDLVRAIRTLMSGRVYLSPDAATAVARALEERSRGVAEPVLNDREIVFLKGLAEGNSYKEIAATMELSVKSVENYRAQLAKKLGCASRAELVRYAVRKGLVEP